MRQSLQVSLTFKFSRHSSSFGIWRTGSGTAPGERTCAICASGLRGGETGFLMASSKRCVWRFLMPLELFWSLWFFAKERMKSGEYVVAVLPSFEV